ncbi:nucleoside-triphosphatase THEP1 [Tribolium madens]|uniref:nucleoside-triphosphatase THEP1 n=1 Tax=Tribolium madens TaxID=41895 RepID=UPI001CF734BC|nr:nucleoside-triphosphatase THEP1 [Tribolium madens]XP_044259957.1 nucleoside-triphosphatase THEP1 [Tribolium madens]
MKNIILQGLPGIGKTTLTKKIANKLKEMAIDITGFYTEELRENNYRIGFDVVTLDNKRGILARKSNAEDNSKYKVGNYSVHIEEFEKMVLPIFENVKSIIIIDEIGKMELFSKKFQANIERVITDDNIRIVATVPLKATLPLIQKIKNNNSSHLITVNAGNRDKLLDEIIPLITK